MASNYIFKTLSNVEPYSIPEDKIISYIDQKLTWESGEQYWLGEIDLSNIDITKYNYLLYKYQGYKRLENNNKLYERFIKLEDLLNSRVEFEIYGTEHSFSSTYGTNARITLQNNKLIIYSTNTKYLSYAEDDFLSAIPYFVLV